MRFENKAIAQILLDGPSSFKDPILSRNLAYQSLMTIKRVIGSWRRIFGCLTLNGRGRSLSDLRLAVFRSDPKMVIRLSASDSIRIVFWFSKPRFIRMISMIEQCDAMISSVLNAFNTSWQILTIKRFQFWFGNKIKHRTINSHHQIIVVISFQKWVYFLQRGHKWAKTSWWLIPLLFERRFWKFDGYRPGVFV